MGPRPATVSATRELSGNPGIAVLTSWAGENTILLAIDWPLVPIVVFLPLAARRYRYPGM